jgi:TonB family protein
LRLQPYWFTACLALALSPGAGAQTLHPVVKEYGTPSSPVTKPGAVPYTDIGPYMPNLEKKISAHSPQHFLGTVVVNFKLNKNGSVSDVKVGKSSGMPQIDDTAVSAVKTSAPFDALPSGVKKFVDIKMTFDGTSTGTACHTTFQAH